MMDWPIKIWDKIKSLTLREKELDQADLVMKLVLGTASLRLEKDEYVELAPIMPGQCSAFKLSGCGLPVFEYMMFEKSIMEFINVRVEISKPARIETIVKIVAKAESSTTPERNGEIIPTTVRHKEPFIKLSKQLYQYFSPYASNAKKEVHS